MHQPGGCVQTPQGLVQMVPMMVHPPQPPRAPGQSYCQAPGQSADQPAPAAAVRVLETSIASTRDVKVDPRDFRRSSARHSTPRQSASLQAPALMFWCWHLNANSRRLVRGGARGRGLTMGSEPDDDDARSFGSEPDFAAMSSLRISSGTDAGPSPNGGHVFDELLDDPPGPSTTTFARRRRRRCRRCWTGSRSSFAATVEGRRR